MLLRLLLTISLVSLTLAACGEAAPTVGDAKDFAVACDKANDGKRIAVEGYLRLPESFSGDQSVVLRLYAASDFSGQPIGIQIKLGKQANQLEPVPDQYSDNDLQVHVANGQIVKYGTKVKVSGQVYFPLVAQEFACSLENPLVELVN